MPEGEFVEVVESGAQDARWHRFPEEFKS